MTNPPPPPPPPSFASFRPEPRFFRPPPPKAPHATLSMVLGILSVAGGLVLVVPALLGPVAWYLGASARRTVEREPTRWSGSGESSAGVVLGIIGTGLLMLVIAVLGLAVIGLYVTSRYDAGYGT